MKPGFTIPSPARLGRAKVFAWIVLVQMIGAAAYNLYHQPSAVGLSLLAGLPVFWGGLFGGFGGAAGLLVNLLLAFAAVVYAVNAFRKSKGDLNPRRKARKVIIFTSCVLTWCLTQFATTALVIWVLNSVWG